MAFGEILRNARVQKGLTPSDVAESTHMLVQVVEGLEKEDFRRIAAPIYGRGFVKLYAELLELDPEPLIRDFMNLYSGARPPAVVTKEVEPAPTPRLRSYRHRHLRLPHQRLHQHLFQHRHLCPRLCRCPNLRRRRQRRLRTMRRWPCARRSVSRWSRALRCVRCRCRMMLNNGRHPRRMNRRSLPCRRRRRPVALPNPKKISGRCWWLSRSRLMTRPMIWISSARRPLLLTQSAVRTRSPRLCRQMPRRSITRAEPRTPVAHKGKLPIFQIGGRIDRDAMPTLEDEEVQARRRARMQTFMDGISRLKDGVGRSLPHLNLPSLNLPRRAWVFGGLGVLMVVLMVAGITMLFKLTGSGVKTGPTGRFERAAPPPMYVD